MTKERILKYSTEYLAHAHETLRKAFRDSPFEEKIFVDAVLDSLKNDVEQLESLRETMLANASKRKELIEETEE